MKQLKLAKRADRRPRSPLHTLTEIAGQLGITLSDLRAEFANAAKRGEPIPKPEFARDMGSIRQAYYNAGRVIDWHRKQHERTEEKPHATEA
jgi:hypothetical protein